MSAELPVVETKVARAVHGENFFRGYAVEGELAGRARFWSIFSLAIGHRLLTEEEEGALDDLYVAHLVGEPRIWPLKLTRIVASYGGPVAGFCAGVLVTEESRIGPASHLQVARLLTRLYTEAGGPDASEDEIAAAMDRLAVDPLRVAGFGVPFREQDERLVSIHRLWQARGRDKLPYARFYATLVRVMDRYGRKPNIAGPMGVTCLDIGFSVEQCGLVGVGLAIGYFLANATEGAEQKHPVFRKLPDAVVSYRGPEARVSRRTTALTKP